MTQSPRAAWNGAVMRLDQLPPDRGAEVAFLGRSNSGKSSAINAITGCRGLAFVSRTPGRTQSLNFFVWGPNRRLVDLPGYGYAAVPVTLSQQWAALLGPYLQSRASLAGLVLVMDVRHPFTERDRMLIDVIAPLDKPLLVLLTKCDKLSREQASRALAAARAVLVTACPHGSIQLFSAKSGTGVQAARGTVNLWLERGKKNPPVKGE